MGPMSVCYGTGSTALFCLDFRFLLFILISDCLIEPEYRSVLEIVSRVGKGN